MIDYKKNYLKYKFKYLKAKHKQNRTKNTIKGGSEEIAIGVGLGAVGLAAMAYYGLSHTPINNDSNCGYQEEPANYNPWVESHYLAAEYKLLESTPGDTADTIKKNYKRLAKQYHPDKNKSGQEMFQNISASYDTIKDSFDKETRGGTLKKTKMSFREAEQMCKNLFGDDIFD